MLHKNKRGVEQPQVIIYVLYTVILAIAGIYIAFNFLGGIDLNVKFEDHTTRFNTLTARLVGTSECLAHETSYNAPFDQRNFEYSVFGVLDRTKVDDSIVTQNCVSMNRQFWLELTYIDESFSTNMWNCPRGQATCGEPIREMQSWPSREYPVLVQDGFELIPAKLEVRLSPA